MKWCYLIIIGLSCSYSCVKRSEDAGRAPNEPRLPDENRGVTPQVENSPSSPKPKPGESGTSPSPNAPSPNAPVEDNMATFKKSFLGVTWKLCYTQDVTSTRVDTKFNENGTWNATSTSYKGVNCKGTVTQTELEGGTYVLSQGAKPGLFPLTLTHTVGRTGSTYELIGLRGDFLHFGKFDDVYDGSTPEKRPVELNLDGYGSGERLPITTI